MEEKSLARLFFTEEKAETLSSKREKNFGAIGRERQDELVRAKNFLQKEGDCGRGRLGGRLKKKKVVTIWPWGVEKGERQHGNFD